MKRYLSLWLPDWPLTRLRRARRSTLPTRLPTGATPARPPRPFALTETSPAGLTIAAATPAARALGVVPGLGLSDARARVPHLATAPIDRAADQAALQALGLWLIRLAPLVALDGPDGLMLDTTGCAHLYGGEAGLMAELSRLLDRDGLPHRLGLAGTQAAAAALARAAPGTGLPPGAEAEGLASLPMTALRLSDEAETLLRRFGLTRIGQLYDIDRKALARRFPSRSAADAVLLRRDQALGQRAAPLDPLRPAPAHSVHLPCPEPIGSSDAVRQGLDQLAHQLCDRLAAQGRGARGFTLLAFHADGRHDSISVQTARPVRDPDHVQRLFGEQIDQLDPGFGIDLLLLEAERTGPMDLSAMALSGDLAASDADPVALAALADRLQARLGPGRVRVGRGVADHIPEQSEIEMPFDGDLPDLPTAGPQGPRPVRLLTPPERVTVLAEVPDGPPQRFIWRRLPRRVVRADGPERISPAWWRHHAPLRTAATPPGTDRAWLSPKMDPRADADRIREARAALEAEDLPGEPVRTLPRARDYYRVEDEAGRRYWLFRDGLYADGRGGPPDWYVHGLFA